MKPWQFQAAHPEAGAWALSACAPPTWSTWLSSYIEWRAAADAAICAYRRWIDAPPPEREQRFSAYTAALDQEEAAATAYARSIANFAL